MSTLTAIQRNNTRIGTCPHGLPLGACPICNGMGGGGGMKKADFSAKPGEMSWNECAAIGAFLRAQQNAKLQKQQDIQNFIQSIHSFQNALLNSSQRLANISQMLSNTMPAIIAKPISFVLNTIIGNVLKVIANIPTTISNLVNNIQQKLADISDKLTAMIGELKTAIAKKISDSFKVIKKKIKSLFSIFGSNNADNEEKEIDETKKAFELKTFIHDLYKKLTKNEKDLDKDDN